MVGSIIARQAELANVDDFLERRAEWPAALAFEGAAGIGKTRLWREGIDRARTRGLRVLATRPGSAEVRLAFAGIADLLRDVLEEVLAELPAPQSRALAVALLVEEAEGRAPDDRAVAAALAEANVAPDTLSLTNERQPDPDRRPARHARSDGVHRHDDARDPVPVATGHYNRASVAFEERRDHVHRTGGNSGQGRRGRQPHAEPDHDLRLPERADSSARRVLRPSEVNEAEGARVTRAPSTCMRRLLRRQASRSRGRARGSPRACGRRFARGARRGRTASHSGR
jgi:hypothetical protein